MAEVTYTEPEVKRLLWDCAERLDREFKRLHYREWWYALLLKELNDGIGDENPPLDLISELDSEDQWLLD